MALAEGGVTVVVAAREAGEGAEPPMAATRFTLIDGTRIQLSKAMRNALLAMPDDGFSHSARVVERMRDLGLVEARESQGLWELTDQGRHVRRQFPGAEGFALSLPLTSAQGVGEDTGTGRRA